MVTFGAVLGLIFYTCLFVVEAKTKYKEVFPFSGAELKKKGDDFVQAVQNASEGRIAQFGKATVDTSTEKGQKIWNIARFSMRWLNPIVSFLTLLPALFFIKGLAIAATLQIAIALFYTFVMVLMPTIAAWTTLDSFKRNWWSRNIGGKTGQYLLTILSLSAALMGIVFFGTIIVT